MGCLGIDGTPLDQITPLAAVEQRHSLQQPGVRGWGGGFFFFVFVFVFFGFFLGRVDFGFFVFF